MICIWIIAGLYISGRGWLFGVELSYKHEGPGGSGVAACFLCGSCPFLLHWRPPGSLQFCYSQPSSHTAEHIKPLLHWSQHLRGWEWEPHIPTRKSVSMWVWQTVWHLTTQFTDEITNFGSISLEPYDAYLWVNNRPLLQTVVNEWAWTWLNSRFSLPPSSDSLCCW